MDVVFLETSVSQEVRQAIAVLSYLGVIMEGGYEKHEPVLLGYRPSRAPA